jgi:hypothetical protein
MMATTRAAVTNAVARMALGFMVQAYAHRIDRHPRQAAA